MTQDTKVVNLFAGPGASPLQMVPGNRAGALEVIGHLR